MRCANGVEALVSLTSNAFDKLGVTFGKYFDTHFWLLMLSFS